MLSWCIMIVFTVQLDFFLFFLFFLSVMVEDFWQGWWLLARGQWDWSCWPTWLLQEKKSMPFGYFVMVTACSEKDLLVLLFMSCQCKNHQNVQSRLIVTCCSLSCHFFVTALSWMVRSEREVQQKPREMFRGWAYEKRRWGKEEGWGWGAGLIPKS